MSLTCDEYEKLIGTIDASSFKDEAERTKAYHVTRRLLTRVESPAERWVMMGWGYLSELMCFKICADIDLFPKWKADGGGPKTAEQLAEMTGTDPLFVSRVLRHLVSLFALDTTAEGSFALKPLTLAAANNSFKSVMNYTHDVNIPLFETFPQWIADIKYKNPSDPQRTNWQHLHDIGKAPDPSFFAFLAQHPQKAAEFGQVMELVATLKSRWVLIYPIENLVKNAERNQPILVDVGGSIGHDIEQVRATYPSLPNGSLVLQDTPETIAAAQVQPPIKAMSHDFFTPQPIKGAYAYFLHFILHDWPDEKARQILQQIVPAMEHGYSRILICETIITAKNLHFMTTGSDVTMMALFSAHERTNEMWDTLLKSAGLKIVKIWTSPTSYESIIEAMLE